LAEVAKMAIQRCIRSTRTCSRHLRIIIRTQKLGPEKIVKKLRFGGKQEDTGAAS